MALDVSTQRLDRFQHLVRCALFGRLESQSVDNMADPTEALIFVSRPGVDVDPYSRERSREDFGSDP
jgi:hypothetical protein